MSLMYNQNPMFEDYAVENRRMYPNYGSIYFQIKVVQV